MHREVSTALPNGRFQSVGLHSSSEKPTRCRWALCVGIGIFGGSHKTGPSSIIWALSGSSAGLKHGEIHVCLGLLSSHGKWKHSLSGTAQRVMKACARCALMPCNLVKVDGRMALMAHSRFQLQMMGLLIQGRSHRASDGFGLCGILNFGALDVNRLCGTVSACP